MLKFSKLILVVTLLGCVSAGCGISERVRNRAHRKAVRYYNNGRYKKAIKQYRKFMIDKRDPDYVLNLLRCGSCSLRMRDYSRAKRYFASAVRRMGPAHLDGEYRAILYKENCKSFLGDPYEQMFANIYLGLLDAHSNDWSKARACFKNAYFCDFGTRKERYQADCVLPLVLEAFSSVQLGEYEYAKEILKEAKQVARWAHVVKNVASIVNEKVEIEVSDLSSFNRLHNEKIIVLAADVFLTEFSALSKAEPKKYKKLFSAARESSFDRAYDLCENVNERSEIDKPVWEGIRESDFSEMKKHIIEITRYVRKHFKRNSINFKRVNKILAGYDKMISNRHNVLIIRQVGNGPRKYREGQYGQTLIISKGSDAQEGVFEIYKNREKIASANCLANTYFQASTRGGRSMDEILKIKAAVKLLALKVSETCDDIANEPGGDDGLKMGASIVGLFAKLIHHGVDSRADIRYWEYLPAQLYVATAKLKPGEHELQIRSGNSESSYTNEKVKIQVHKNKSVVIINDLGKME